MKAKKTVWIPGDTTKVEVGSEGQIILYFEGDFSEEVHFYSWGKKPRKNIVTDNGEYPKAWPLKRLNITVEVE